MLIGNVIMAALGIIMGILFIWYRSDYAHWASDRAPVGLASEPVLRAMFLALGLGMNAGSLAVLLGGRI